jgi:signal transduction histidine kinase
MSGIRRRLSFSFLLVAFTVVTVTAGLILVAGSRLFSGYLLSAQNLRHQRIISVLEQTYAGSGGWEGVAVWLGGSGAYFGMMSGTSFQVQDAGGRVVLASEGYTGSPDAPDTGGPMSGGRGWGRRFAAAPGGSGPGMGGALPGGMMGPGMMRWSEQSPVPPAAEWRKPLRVAGRQVTYPLQSGKERIGTVTFELPRTAAALGTLEGTFRQLVGLAALAAALLAGAFGWLSGSLLARRLVQPILALRDATRLFAAGHLEARVQVPEANGGEADELAELGQSFNLMAERLEQLEQMRRQLTADVAHELRTPVAAARNLVEAMQDGILPADAENLTALDRELVRLGRIVGDLRDLSVAESGKLQLARERLDLREVLDSVAESWRARFAAASLDLTSSLPDDAVPVTGDAQALERVFGNLLANAHKYTGSGGRVTVSLTREGSQAMVRVTDTGVGISEAEQPLAFERFFRGAAARQASAEGTGVGLAIVREIIQAHGGEVGLASRPGQGTTVTVRLPLA